MESSIIRTEDPQATLWKIWQYGQSDAKYSAMLQELKSLERKYGTVLSKLSDEQQDIICDFVYQCEAMSWRMLEIACSYIKLAE